MKQVYESNFHTYTSRTYQALSHIPQQNHIEVIQLLCFMNHCLFYEEYKKFDEQAAKLHYFIELAEGLIEEEQIYNQIPNGYINVCPQCGIETDEHNRLCKSCAKEYENSYIPNEADFWDGDDSHSE